MDPFQEIKDYYNQSIGFKIISIDVYEDPSDGSVHVDVKTENGVTLPLLMQSE